MKYLNLTEKISFNETNKKEITDSLVIWRTVYSILSRS